MGGTPRTATRDALPAVSIDSEEMDAMAELYEAAGAGSDSLAESAVSLQERLTDRDSGGACPADGATGASTSTKTAIPTDD